MLQCAARGLAFSSNSGRFLVDTAEFWSFITFNMEEVKLSTHMIMEKKDNTTTPHGLCTKTMYDTKYKTKFRKFSRTLRL